MEIRPLPPHTRGLGADDISQGRVAVCLRGPGVHPRGDRLTRKKRTPGLRQNGVVPDSTSLAGTGSLSDKK